MFYDPFAPSHLRTFVSAVVAIGLGATTLSAADLYWYPGSAPNQGGTGTWDATTKTLWSTTSGGTKTAPGSVPGSTDNVIFGGTAGTVTLSSTQSVSDFRVDTAGYVFTNNNVTSRSILVDSFSGSELGSATFNASGREMTLGLSVRENQKAAFTGTITDGGNKLSLSTSGSGLLDLSQATLTYTGGTNIVGGGTLRVSTSGTGALPGGQIQLANSTSGILELAGDGSIGSFSRVYSTGIRIGTNASDMGGFSARDGVVTVNINRPSGSLIWSTTASITAAMRVSTFVLGASSGNGTLRFTSNVVIDENELTIRTERGENSAVAVDGDFAATFKKYTTIDNDAILNRAGDGVLRLSGNSTEFNMRFNLTEGTTLVDGQLTSDTANTTYGINVAATAILGGGGTVTYANSNTSIKVAGTIMGGRGDGTQTLSINSNVVMGLDSVLLFGLGTSSGDQLARTGGTWSFQSGQRVTLLDAGFDGSTAHYALITGLGSSVDVSSWSLYHTDSGIDGTFRYDSGSIYFDVIPEPSIAWLLVLGLGMVFFVRRSRDAKAS